MLKDVGLVVNCGRWHLKTRSKRERLTVNFAFSVEVSSGKESEVVEELRSAIQETVGTWSRSCWRREQKIELERKQVK